METILARRLSSCVLSIVAAVLVGGQTGCVLDRASTSSPTPIVFAQPPTLPQIIEAVNANSTRVRQLHADNVRLTIPGQLGSLQARIDFDRPNRFRLFGETRFTGGELDLGSNDESFWLWAKRIQPPTVFYGRHDQFFQSAAQQVLPVPPNWIIEALGLVYLDPNGTHELYGSNGLFEIRTRMPSPRGELLRVLKIDQRRAWVVEQRLYGANNQELAGARAADFQYDALQNVSLPRRLQVRLPPAAFSFTLEVPQYVVNQPASDPLELWSMPQFPNHEYKDVANPQDIQGLLPLGGANWQSPVAGPLPATDFYDGGTTDERPRTGFRAAFGRLRLPWLR